MRFPWHVYEKFSIFLLRILEFLFNDDNSDINSSIREYQQRFRTTVISRKRVRNFPDSEIIKGHANMLAIFFLCAPVIVALLSIGIIVGLNLPRGGMLTFTMFHWIYPLDFLCITLFTYLRYKAFRLERKEKRFLESHAEEFTYGPADKPTNLGMIFSSAVGLIIGCLIVLFSLYTDGFI